MAEDEDEDDEQPTPQPPQARTEPRIVREWRLFREGFTELVAHWLAPVEIAAPREPATKPAKASGGAKVGRPPDERERVVGEMVEELKKDPSSLDGAKPAWMASKFDCHRDTAIAALPEARRIFAETGGN